jgi:hypothetical protein
MDEAARELRVSRRWLQDFIQRHPYYRSAGRKKLFAAEDINRLIEAMSCPGSSSRRVRPRHAIGTSAASTSESSYATALALARKQRRSAFSEPGANKPNVVNFPREAEPSTRRQPS